jgi:hypothetical protein
MTRDEFIKRLEQYGAYFTYEGDQILVRDDESQGKIHVDSSNHVDMEKVIDSIPDNVTFENNGNLWFNSVKSIGKNVIFNNSGLVNLESLETITEGIKFRNKSFVDLRNVTEIVSPITFENGAGVYLLSMDPKDINSDVKFHNRGGVAIKGFDTREIDLVSSAILFPNGISKGRILNKLLKNIIL